MIHRPLAPMGGEATTMWAVPHPHAQVIPTYVGIGGKPRIPLCGMARLMQPVRTACGFEQGLKVKLWRVCVTLCVGF
jgi:hypothetical protein